MTTLEPILRSRDFSQGVSFIGTDGGRWYLPVLDEAAWDRLPEIRDWWVDHYRTADNPEMSVSLAFRTLLLGHALLMENYDLIYEDFPRFIMDPHGITSSLATDAILTAMRTPVIHALAIIEREGLDRSRATIMVLSRDHPAIGIGWHHHDGIMFDN